MVQAPQPSSFEDESDVGEVIGLITIEVRLSNCLSGCDLSVYVCNSCIVSASYIVFSNSGYKGF